MRMIAETPRGPVEPSVGKMRRVGLPLLLCLLACGEEIPVGLDRDDPNGPPDTPGPSELEVRIVSPNGDASALAGAPTRFEAAFSFVGNPVSPEVVEWRSSLKGTLGVGNPLEDVRLTPGEHEITVEAIFDGNRASAATELQVGDIEVEIVTPEDGAVLQQGESVAFEARAHAWDGDTLVELVDDAMGPAQREAQFEWTLDDDDDSPLARTARFETSQLPSGNREIEVEVRFGDIEGEASVSVAVRRSNAAPVEARINSPECGAVLENDAPVELLGIVSAGATAEWRDAITGLRGEGTRFVFGDGASPGKHRVTLTATGPTGESAQASCDLTFIEAGGALDDLFPDTTHLRSGRIGSGVRALAGEPLVIAGSATGVSLITEDGTFVDYDGNALALPSAAANARALLVSDGRVWIGGATGLSICSLEGEALTECTFVGSDAVSALESLASDDSIVLAALADRLRIERVGEPVREIPWSDLSVAPPVALRSLASDVALGGANGVCLLADVEQLLEDAPARCGARLDATSSLLPSDRVEALERDGERLWIGTEAGLARWTPGTGGLLNFEAAPLGMGAITALFRGEDEVLWVGTDGGVVRLDLRLETRVEILPEDWGGSAPRVNALSVGPEDGLWLGTDEGVFVYRGI